MRLLIMVIITMLFSPAMAAADAEQPVRSGAWGSISDNEKFKVEFSGDMQAEAGATLAVASSGVAAKEFGGAISRLDARPLRGRRVVLSANMTTTAGTSGAAVWMRADAEGKRKLIFVTSAEYPLAGDQEAALRQVSLLVPAEAVELVFGVVFGGSGRTEARELRLRISEPAAASSQATPRQVLDAAIAAAREHALNTGKVDWDKTTADLYAASTQAKVPADVYPQIRALLSALQDGHSLFLTPDAAQQHMAMGAATAPAEVKLLDGGIGYARMPGFSGMNEQEELKFCNSIAGPIETLAKQAAAGWVVDLRTNSGGNMWPMLAALKPLLGDGVVGRFRNGEGKLADWRAGDRIDDPAKKRRKDLTATKVAVLLGPHTSSSGEAVAVAFHGRPQTRSFGQPTAGQASSNSAYPLPDGSQIYLTTAIDLDRNGVAFGGKLKPDQLTGEAIDGADPTLAAATAWLLGKNSGS